MSAGQITTAMEAREAERAAAPVVSARQALESLLERNRHAIGLSLPNAMDEDRFRRLLLTVANTNPDLLQCEPRSFLAAGVLCAQLGLEPNDPRGLAYLIPYKDARRGHIVQVVIGYRGMLELTRRSGLVTAISAVCVYRGDTFHYERGLHDRLQHIPGDHDQDPADITHVWAKALVSGDVQWEVMTRREVDRIRERSPGAKSARSPWTSDYAEMAKKTVLRRLCKYLPQTTEMARATAHDDAAPLTLREPGEVIDPEDIVETVAALDTSTEEA